MFVTAEDKFGIASRPVFRIDGQSGIGGDEPSVFYRRRRPEDYDRALCLIPQDVLDFVLATQPKEWEKLKQHHGAGVREQFLRRPSL